MKNSSFIQLIGQEFKALFQINPTSRVWHLPLLASLCVGIPLFIGTIFHNYSAASFASLGGLVILYYSSSSELPVRMIILLACSFGFLLSFTISAFFSFNPILSSIALGVITVLIHWIILYLKAKPPGSFFFIMIASMGSCLPHDLHAIPIRIGFLALGTMSACVLALVYGLILQKRTEPIPTPSIRVKGQKDNYTNFIEAVIIGAMISISLLIGHLLNLINPYWVTISCLAILQAVSLRHVWQRMIQRILGTFVGLGLFWILLLINKTPLGIVVIILILQFIVESLIVRNYVFAVVFITPLALLLTEFANPLLQQPTMFISIRFWDICIGSVLGAIGGSLLVFFRKTPIAH